ncbi:unnamed protein product [Protopolystoma xenopodis]|uniref:Uncharacterized protein n=1 Tax=Protopolystoma xenopodis TaxID=117903 RepID=A0A3S5CIP6_9PLAT|nr:unnamed protein product [Protopolystoma xenopodis]
MSLTASKATENEQGVRPNEQSWLRKWSTADRCGWARESEKGGAIRDESEGENFNYSSRVFGQMILKTSLHLGQLLHSPTHSPVGLGYRRACSCSMPLYLAWPALLLSLSHSLTKLH